MEENQPPNNPLVDAQLRALSDPGARPGYGKAALEAACPSLVSIVLTAVGLAAIGVVSHRAMRKTIMGERVSYERYERHTPDCLEIYERFEQGAIVVQRG